MGSGPSDVGLRDTAAQAPKPSASADQNLPTGITNPTLLSHGGSAVDCLSAVEKKDKKREEKGFGL